MLTAYIMDTNPDKEVEVNKEMLSRAVQAVEKLSPNLKFVVLPSGTKDYGVHLLDGFPHGDKLPLKESTPRIPEPHASQMFYYAQADELDRLSKGKAWTWAGVIPDVITGFVPQNNFYSLAQWLGLYLSLHREIYGEGSEVVFPGTDKSYGILSNETYQDTIAKESIIASLKPEVSGGQRFNSADSAQPSSWSEKWPIICRYFNLKGVAPPSEGSGPDPAQFIQDHIDEWKKVEKKYGLVTGRVGNDISFNIFVSRSPFKPQACVHQLKYLAHLHHENVQLRPSPGSDKGAWYDGGVQGGD